MLLFDVADVPRPAPGMPDGALIARLRELAEREREARVEFIVYLAELERRRLHLEAGYSSVFAWLVEALQLPRSSAYRRVTAARLVARMPAVTAYLREGRLTLTKLCLLKNVLAPENHLALLEQAASLPEAEVEELAAQLDPSRRPAARESIRAVARPVQVSLELARPPASAAVEPNVSRPPASAAVEPTVPVPAMVVEHVVEMTVGAEFMELLEQVRAELSHSHPGAPLEALLAECMKTTLAVRRKRARAETKRPSAAATPSASRRIPATVRRQVWARDQSRCTFVSADGRRCEATHQLELHHEVPFARGGPATVGNLRLLCRSHNGLLARRDFGDRHMDRFSAHGSQRGPPH